MNWKFIFNPFLKFSERQLITVGSLAFISLNIVCFLFGFKMDSLLHFNSGKQNSFWEILLQNSGVIALFTLFLWGLGLVFNKKTRLIDIFNMILFTLIPTTLTLLLMGIPYFNQTAEKIANASNHPDAVSKMTLELAIISLFTLFLLPLLVYTIVLLYNGFKTATNIKKWQQTALFFGVLFLLNLIFQILIK